MQEGVRRVSMKLMNVTPDKLPDELLQQITETVASHPVSEAHEAAGQPYYCKSNVLSGRDGNQLECQQSRLVHVGRAARAVQAFIETFIRPGCVHITVDAALLPGEERSRLLAGGAEAVAQRLLQLGGWQEGGGGEGSPWAEEMLVSCRGYVPRALCRAGLIALSRACCRELHCRASSP